MRGEATRGSPRARLVRYLKTRIEIVKGCDTGTQLETAGQSVRVGTSADNHLVLTDDTVSRHHFSLGPCEQGVRIRDEGSTNGVLVQGMRVYDVVVAEMVTVQVGQTLVRITPLSDAVNREQAISDRFGDLLGSSPAMRELFADLDRIAPTDATLLVEGETGTGKEVVAESVHRASARAEGPYVVFDCGAVAPSLAESELFGHERGAFTGASGTRRGVFELAHGGTLFLDELGELPKDLQPKLLRVLEKREVRRLGGSKTIPVDVRLIAATNRNLAAEVRRGAFRQDLYFRLAMAHVHVPPLRDRMMDLPILVEHFLSLSKPPRSSDQVPDHVWRLFESYRWPGNVRELSNAVQRFLLTPHKPLRELDVERSALELRKTDKDTLLPLRIARRQASDEFERSYLRTVLKAADHNVTRAAALAEVSRQMIQKLMRKHEFESSEFSD